MKVLKNNLSKILSFILSFLVIFYVVPLTVYAENSDNVTDFIEQNEDAVASSTNSETELVLIDENTSNFGDIDDISAHTGNDGLESYYPTDTHSAGTGGAGGINLSTGILTLAIPTLTTTDSLFSFTPTLVYNSSLAGKAVTSENSDVAFNTSYMPYGFKLNIQETITQKSYYDDTGVSHTYYALYDSDGTTHCFFSNESNTEYYDDDGLQLTLTLSNGNIQIEDISETVKTYSSIDGSSWHLTDTTDKYGNQLIFEFNSSYQPTKVIVKPNGLSNIEMLRLLYNGDKLCALYNDSSKDSVILGYSGGNLSTVRYCYGNSNTTEQNIRDAYLNFASAVNVTAYASATYTTDSSGYITVIRDVEAAKNLNYEITDGKISKITEYANDIIGQQASYTYGTGYTDVRSTGNDEALNTADDIITRYIFDEYGRAVSVYSTSVDGTEIYGAITRIYEDFDKSKNSVKESTVLHGVDPEDIIESESFSGEYFATIQGGVNTNASTGTYKQTVMLVENPASLTESNADVGYIISGYGYSNSTSQNSSADFSLGINIYYYQGENQDDVIVTYSFDFADVENAWQYICGKFYCNLESTETANYAFVRKIEVVCSYYGHSAAESESAYAHFKDIALTSFEANNGYSYYYDSSTGNLEAKENSLYQEEYTYDDQNRVTSITNSYGEVFRYEYTIYGEETNHSEKYYKNGILVSTTVYTYNKYGLLIKTSYSGSVEDDLSIGDEYITSCITTVYEYIITSGSKIFGALQSETNTLGYQTLYDIDANNGRMLKVIHLPSNTGYRYSYHGNGQLSSIIPITVSGDTYTDGEEGIYYSYYADGELHYITTGSTVYNMLRDNYGNTSEVSIGDRTLAAYEYYQNNGKLKKVIYGNGFSEEYVYNTLEILSEVWYNYDDGTRERAFSYTYNYDGTLSEHTDHRTGESTEYRYDSLGRLVSVGEKSAGETAYSTVSEIEYNSDGSVASQEYIIPYSLSSSSSSMTLTTSYAHDNNGALLSETHEYLSNNHKISYAYDGLNRSDYISRDFGAFDYTTEYHYFDALDYGEGNNSSYLVDRYVSTAGSSSVTYYYDYDPRGNMTSVIKGDSETIYTYDDIGQLVKESANNILRRYTYDDAGNIVSIENEAIVSDGTIIMRAAPLLHATGDVTYGYTDSEWGDLLTSYNGTAITYDEIGNPLSYYNGTSYTFTWEGRRLVSAVKGTKTMSFTYNGEGIRTSKTVNGVTHTYHLSGSRIVAEEWGNNLSVYIYDSFGTPIGMMYRQTSYAAGVFDVFWFEKNLLGDIVAVYNSSGTLVASYTYTDAWGNQVVTYSNGGGSTGAQYNPFRYRGYYYDRDLGMYYLNSRYYDSKICRFINADSVIADVGDSVHGYNMYSYCFNNPVNMTDDFGSWPSWNDVKSGFRKVTNWVDNKVVQPTVSFVEDVVEDCYNYNSNNQSEAVVFSSNYFSNYKGTLVVKTPFDASFSFDFIGLSTQQQNVNTLKHEYGHTVQIRTMGVLNYITDVFVPSVTINILDRKGDLPYDYYTYPWEAEANELGGSTLSQRGKPKLPQGEYTSYLDLIKLFFK